MSTLFKQIFPSRPWIKVSLLAVFLVSVLNGCAFRRMIYERLDWAIMFELDRYFDLNDVQEERYKKAVKSTLSWIKKERLPKAAALVERLEKAAAAKTLGAVHLEEAAEAFTGWRKEIGVRMEGPSLELAQSLSPGQIRHLKKRLEKSNEDMEELLAEDDEDFPDEVRKSQDKQIKSLEHWYGPLSQEQQNLISGILKSDRARVKERLEQRKRLHAHIIAILESKDKARVGGLIREWIDTGEAWDDKAYRSYREASAQRWGKLLPELHKTLSDKQWTQLKVRLAETRADILKVAASE